MRPLNRRNFISTTAALGGTLATATAFAQEQRGSSVTEPVARIATNDKSRPSVVVNHPLDPALQLAHSSLQQIQTHIRDYTAIVVKRERVNGTLGEYEYLGAKIRNRRYDDSGKLVAPFSVYLTFLKPASMKGREVIYVENKNEGNLVAHEGGMKGRFLPTVTLDPNGMMAMRGQRYPITDMGIENLVLKLIEKGERDKKQGDCGVEFLKGAKVGGRSCTVLTVTHDEKRPCFDFHVAQIFIDDELNIPVRYCAYEWPTTPGGSAELLEEYTYQNIKLNVGLTDADFDQSNAKYRF